MVVKADISNFGFGNGHHATTGNLISRTGMIGMGQKETFYYDQLDRLETINHGTPEVLKMSIAYEPNGNIINKTGLGEYAYHPAKPHAVEYINNTAGLLKSNGQSVEYNAFNKAILLKDTVGNDAYQLKIFYGPDQQRWKTVLYENGLPKKTIIFAGDYEKIIDIENVVTKEYVYLPGGGFYVKQAGQADKIYYTHKDHLGSIMSITDNAGNYVFKATYDAWGNKNKCFFDFKMPPLINVYPEKVCRKDCQCLNC